MFLYRSEQWGVVAVTGEKSLWRNPEHLFFPGPAALKENQKGQRADKTTVTTLQTHQTAASYSESIGETMILSLFERQNIHTQVSTCHTSPPSRSRRSFNESSISLSLHLSHESVTWLGMAAALFKRISEGRRKSVTVSNHRWEYKRSNRSLCNYKKVNYNQLLTMAVRKKYTTFWCINCVRCVKRMI